jgi:anti-anti-sigma factor
MSDINILVVDDDEHVRGVLVDLLGAVGYHVTSAPDGATALQEAESGTYQVILIDVHMPEQDGVQVLRQLRTVAPESQCIMISGVQDAELAETCRRLGAAGFLSKPLRVEEVTGLVDELAKPPEDLFSWEETTEEATQPPASETQAPVDAEPEPSETEPVRPDAGAAPVEGTRLRDPVAVFRRRESGEVLARIACTVYADLDSKGRSAREWRGAVDDFHTAPPGELAAEEMLPGTLVLRDAVRGLFAGDAVLRGDQLTADGPLRHSAPLVRQKVSVTVRKAAKDPSVTVVDLEGDVSDEQVSEFTDALRETIRSGRNRIVVQLDGVSSLGSDAVRACVQMVGQLQSRNGDLRIAGAKGDLWRAIESIGAHRTLSCFATEAEAVASFSRGHGRG